MKIVSNKANGKEEKDLSKRVSPIEGITAIHAKIHGKIFYNLNLWQTFEYKLLFDFKE